MTGIDLFCTALTSSGAITAANATRGNATRDVRKALLRDVFGNPFRPEAIETSWLTWQNHTITKLAQSIYDDRSFEQLPILADALEEAGCANPLILDHCRQPGLHVRGCWVVDCLLGKE
jgi:hypothetical protein